MVASTGRWKLEEEQQRIKRDPEEIEVTALSQLYNDPVLKRNQKTLPLICARGEVTQYVVGDSLSVETRWYVSCSQVQLRVTLDIGCQTIERPFLAPPGVRLLSSEGLGRIEIALPEGVDVDSEAETDVLIEFSKAIATTDVRDCFYLFRMALSLNRFFCIRTVPAHVLSMTGEMLEGQRLEAHTATWRCKGMLSMVFSWSLFLAQSCNEEKACLASSLRRKSGKSTTQLIHDRGPPLVFVAGEQERGGACVFVDNFGAICDNVALSPKTVSEWSDIFKPLSTRPTSMWAEGRPSGQNRTDTSCAHG